MLILNKNDGSFFVFFGPPMSTHFFSSFGAKQAIFGRLLVVDGWCHWSSDFCVVCSESQGRELRRLLFEFSSTPVLKRKNMARNAENYSLLGLFTASRNQMIFGVRSSLRVTYVQGC